MRLNALFKTKFTKVITIISLFSLLIIATAAGLTINSTPSFSAKAANSSLDNIINNQDLEYVEGELIIASGEDNQIKDIAKKASGNEVEIETSQYNIKVLKTAVNKKNQSDSKGRIKKGQLDNKLKKTIEDLKARGITAEPNYIKRGQFRPNDSFYPLQEYLNNTKGGSDIKTEQAWDITRGSSSVIIAIIDSGIDATHPDFIGKIVKPKNIMTGENNANITDNEPHGNFVAGFVAANGNDSQGITGVCPECKIMPIRASFGNEFTSVDIINAIKYAVANGAKVINMSFGGGRVAQEERDTISRAVAQGIVFVGATDNQDFYSVTYPAALPGVISVTGVDSNDKYATGNRRSWVDISAPSSKILSTFAGVSNYYRLLPENNRYAYGTGTSFGTPIVSGIAGLMLSKNPNLSPSQIKQYLKESSENIDLKNPGLQGLIGAGRVNAYGAVFKAVTALDSNWRLLAGTNSNNSVGLDLLLQNKITGQPAIWDLTKEGNLDSGSLVYPGFNAPSWKIISSSDVNRDGIDDLLWQNNDGTPVIWFMDAQHKLINGKTLLNPGTDWRLVSALNSVKSRGMDLLWQNKTTGEPVIWELGTDGSLKAGVSLYPGFNAPSWKIISSSDINRDGVDDLLWQNSDGTPVIWFMDAQHKLISWKVPAQPLVNN